MKRSKKKKKRNKMPLVIVFIVFLLLIGAWVYYMEFYEGNFKEAQDNQKQEQSDADSEENKVDEHKPDLEDKSDQEETDSKDNKEDEKVVTENGYIVGQTLPDKPTYIKGIIIANKKYPLPENYDPGENPEAKKAFNEMAEAAKKEGFVLTAFSGYRSFEYQKSLYNKYAQRDGKDKADRYSARPGYSEHQTGLAFDIGEVGKENLWLTEQFGESEAGKWLVKNADQYGFILRYPKGKENITGYMYESWHFRYLGKDLAKKVKDSGLTLEEYLGID